MIVNIMYYVPIMTPLPHQSIVDRRQPIVKLVNAVLKRLKQPTIYFHYHKAYHHCQHRALWPYYIRWQIIMEIHPTYKTLQPIGPMNILRIQVVEQSIMLRPQFLHPLPLRRVLAVIVVRFAHEIKKMPALNSMAILYFLRIAPVWVSGASMSVSILKIKFYNFNFILKKKKQ